MVYGVGLTVRRLEMKSAALERTQASIQFDRIRERIFTASQLGCAQTRCVTCTLILDPNYRIKRRIWPQILMDSNAKDPIFYVVHPQFLLMERKVVLPC